MISTLLPLLSLVALSRASDPRPIVDLDRDDLVVTESCTVRVLRTPIADANGDGVLQIRGDGVVVDLVGELRGTGSGTAPDAYEGIGIRITARDVTLRGARVSGFRGGIWATGADGLVLAGCDVSDNVRQRLRSTPAAEDASDWLWPHANEENEWLTKYGAGIYVEESAGVVVRDCTARDVQNGICFRAVVDSEVYDNDMSFLSGWGLGMFRSSRNLICRNSFDFCVRGYSHGVYSRGQDSAGILAFEQCCDNVIAFNSATHSGDSFFGFCGLAALDGEDTPARTGNNRNLIYGNDFSYAPAIGIEMTFSFDNVFVRNRLVGGNYGVWGGYSKDTTVAENEIAENEIAGVAVEHGSGWGVFQNRFRENRRGVELWWDQDDDLLAKPWARLNGADSAGHVILRNEFRGDRVGIVLRATQDVTLGDNTFVAVGAEVEADEKSSAAEVDLVDIGFDWDAVEARVADLPGVRKAVGLRSHLRGRHRIVMTEWGPYDWRRPHLRRAATRRGEPYWSLLGDEPLVAAAAQGDVRVSNVRDGHSGPIAIFVQARRPGRLTPYRLTVRTPTATFEREGIALSNVWEVRTFAWTKDPREDPAGWLDEARGGTAFRVPRLDLAYGGGGPSQLTGVPDAVERAALPTDRFGTLARTEVTFPPGRWRITTVSDDGIRVVVGDEVLIEDWTWHPPKTHSAVLTFAEETTTDISVEHFELDGFAVLSLALEPAEL